MEPHRPRRYVAKANPRFNKKLELSKSVQIKETEKETSIVMTWLHRWDRGEKRKQILEEFLGCFEKASLNYFKSMPLLLSRIMCCLRLTYLVTNWLHLLLRSICVIVSSKCEVLQEVIDSGTILTVLDIVTLGKEGKTSHENTVLAMQLLDVLCGTSQTALDILSSRNCVSCITAMLKSTQDECLIHVCDASAPLLIKFCTNNWNETHVEEIHELTISDKSTSQLTACKVILVMLEQKECDWSMFLSPVVCMLQQEKYIELQQAAMEVMVGVSKYPQMFLPVVQHVLGMMFCSIGFPSEQKSRGPKYNCSCLLVMVMLSLVKYAESKQQLHAFHKTGAIVSIISFIIDIRNFEVQKLAMETCRILCQKVDMCFETTRSILGENISTRIMASTSKMDGGILRDFIQDDALRLSIGSRLERRGWFDRNQKGQQKVHYVDISKLALFDEEHHDFMKETVHSVAETTTPEIQVAVETAIITEIPEPQPIVEKPFKTATKQREIQVQSLTSSSSKKLVTARERIRIPFLKQELESRACVRNFNGDIFISRSRPKGSVLPSSTTFAQEVLQDSLALKYTMDTLSFARSLNMEAKKPGYHLFFEPEAQVVSPIPSSALPPQLREAQSEELSQLDAKRERRISHNTTQLHVKKDEIRAYKKRSSLDARKPGAENPVKNESANKTTAIDPGGFDFIMKIALLKTKKMQVIAESPEEIEEKALDEKPKLKKRTKKTLT